MVCYYGAHYQAFVLLPDAGGWALFDDASVSLVGDGSWRAVREKCRLGRIQPSVIFFEAARGAHRGSALGALRAAAATASELQPRLRDASTCQPLVPFPPQRPILVPPAIVDPSDHWAAGGLLLGNGHSSEQLVSPPGLGLSAAAPEMAQFQHSLAAAPTFPLHAPAFELSQSAAVQAHGKGIGEAHSRVPQPQQPWKHPQHPQQHAGGAVGTYAPLVGNGRAAQTEPSSWTVPSREALEALLAAAPPGIARGSPHLSQASASTAPPSAVGAAWHAASLPASVKERASLGMAFPQTMLNVPRPDIVQRLLPLNGFPALHGGK